MGRMQGRQQQMQQAQRRAKVQPDRPWRCAGGGGVTCNSRGSRRQAGRLGLGQVTI